MVRCDRPMLCCGCCWGRAQAFTLASFLALSPLPQAGEEVLGTAAKLSVSKDHIIIVGDGRTEAEVKARVKQIKNLAAGGAGGWGVRGGRGGSGGTQWWDTVVAGELEAAGCGGAGALGVW